MKRFVYSITIIAMLSMVFFSGCKKELEIAPTGKAVPSLNSGSEVTLSTLSGIVVDENNVALAGVTVQAHGQVYTTNAVGYFIFEDLTIPNNRYILKFSLANYFSVTRSDELVNTTKPIQVKVSMMPMNTVANLSDTVSFPSNVGGNLVIGTVLDFTFPPDIYMYESGLPYNGRVHIAALYMDPTDVNYSIRTHGGDQIGSYEENSDEYILRAFAGTNIMLSDDNGIKLQLNPNMSEEVAFKLEIPVSLRAACPNEIDIWTFDDGMGLRGSTTTSSTTASKEGVTVSGMVGHFSYLSCELAYSTLATVTGRVVNTNGDPVAGLTVSIGETFAVTDLDGYYSRSVIAGVPLTVGIYPDYLYTPVVPVNVTPYGNTTVDFTVSAQQLFYGTLVDCNGSPVAGNVTVQFGPSESVSTYTTTGSFVVEIPNPTAQVDVWAFGNGTDIYLPFLDATIPQEIALCPPLQTGQNMVTLNGGDSAYAVTETVFINSLTGYYTVGTGETAISLSNLNYNGLSFDVYIVGYGTGTFPFTSIIPYVSYDIYQPDPPWTGGTTSGFQSGTVTITSYGPVGGLIEGTFTGLTVDGTQVDVQFSVIRGPDVP